MASRLISNRRLALGVSVAYVGAATVYILSSFGTVTEGFLYNFFAPATLFPGLILFMEPDPWPSLMICQIITTAVAWAILWGLLSLVRKC